MNRSSVIQGAEYLEARRIRYTFLAQAIASFIILGLFAYPIIKEKLLAENTEPIKVKAKKVVNYSELSAPPPIDLEKIEPEILEAKPKIKTVKFLQPVAKKDEEVIEEEDLPSMEDLSKTQIADFEQDGIDSIVVSNEEVIEVVPEETEKVYGFVEQMPEFPNGEAALFEYLSENIQYPQIAKDAGVQGVVIVGFVIETDGSISDVKVLRGVNYALDKEASRVIREMPKWQAGVQNGRIVRVSYSVPIRFRLVSQ